MKEEMLDVKVTKCDKGWFVRITNIKKDNEIICESLCNMQCDIGYATRDMLRTLDKLGYDSPMAHASRMRGKNFAVMGKIKFTWGSFKDRIQ